MYQNKFHNFWSYIVTYKNHGNCIFQLMDWIFEHSKFIQISSFKILTHTRSCTEATQNFSKFLELWLFFYKFSKDSVLFTNSENKNFHCSSSPCSLTDWPHASATVNKTRRRGQLRPSKRVGDDSPVRRAAPTWSTPSRASIPSLRTEKSTPDGTQRRPWRLRPNGGRCN